jgi:hypothetical protein
MNQFSDIFSSKQSIQTNNNKTNKRKLDELVDPSSTDFDSSSSLKPQKTEQVDSERSLSRTGTRKKLFLKTKHNQLHTGFSFSFI